MAAFPRSGDTAPRGTSANRLRGLAARSAAPAHSPRSTDPAPDEWDATATDRPRATRWFDDVRSPEDEPTFEDAPSFGGASAEDHGSSDRHRFGADPSDLPDRRRGDETSGGHHGPPELSDTLGWVPDWAVADPLPDPSTRPLRRHRSPTAARSRPSNLTRTAEHDAASSVSGEEPWLDEPLDELGDAEPSPGPGFRAVRHRADRWSQRWVPEPIRQSRSRLSGRAAVLLTVIAVVAVVVAGWTWWSGRPERTPVAGTEDRSVSVQQVSATGQSPPPPTVDAPPPPSAPTPSAPPAQIWVSVTGRVVTPGLYQLPGDARVADALTAAGGLIDQIDLTGINLAQPLTDGQSVVVAEHGTAVASASAPPGGIGAAAPPIGLLNLNTADQTAFEALPGVGPVMAQAILTWRTDNGPFSSVDQLQEISGIGPARFAQLAPLVTV